MSRQPLGDETKTSVSFHTFGQIAERAVRLIPAIDELSEEYAGIVPEQEAADVQQVLWINYLSFYARPMCSLVVAYGRSFS
jgi:hypothetical protein